VPWLNISDSSVGMTLPDKGKGERQWGIEL
jgi:hypothetical protein